LEFTGEKTKSNSKKKIEQHFSYIITFLYCPHPKCPRPEGRVILATTKNIIKGEKVWGRSHL
jgi:hypothetical protein